MTVLVFLAVIAVVVIAAGREIRAERRRIVAIEGTRPIAPLFAERRHGCLVAFAAFAFPFWLTMFTFTYDNPDMGKGVPAWIHQVLMVPSLIAGLVGIYGAPVTLVLGLIGWRSGKVSVGLLRWILATFVFLYTSLAILVVFDAWYPHEAMGEFSGFWKELGLLALVGELLFCGLLVAALRASKIAAQAAPGPRGR